MFLPQEHRFHTSDQLFSHKSILYPIFFPQLGFNLIEEETT